MTTLQQATSFIREMQEEVDEIDDFLEGLPASAIGDPAIDQVIHISNQLHDCIFSMTKKVMTTRIGRAR